MGESFSSLMLKCVTGTGEFSLDLDERGFGSVESRKQKDTATEQLRLQQQGERLCSTITNAQKALIDKIDDYEKRSELARAKAKAALRVQGGGKKRAATRHLRRHRQVEAHLGFLTKLDTNLDALSFRIESARTTADYGLVLREVTSYIKAETSTDVFNEDATQDKVDEIIHMDSVVRDVNAALEELTSSMMEDPSECGDMDGLEGEMEALLLEIKQEDGEVKAEYEQIYNNDPSGPPPPVLTAVSTQPQRYTSPPTQDYSYLPYVAATTHSEVLPDVPTGHPPDMVDEMLPEADM